MFDKHFEIFLADTAESQKIHYSIRYQVYCEEMGFEEKERFPSEMEFDDNDENSVHFIARDKKSKEWIGAIRLIYKQNESLPIEQNCELDKKIVNSVYDQVVELSRLCLIKEVRRHFKDVDPPYGIVDQNAAILADTKKVKFIHNQNNNNRTIMWGLLHAAAEYCYFNNIQTQYFMTTSSLAKLLRRGGLNVINIGKPCEHRGMRFPFKFITSEMYQNPIWQNGYSNGYRLYSEFSGKSVVSK